MLVACHEEKKIGKWFGGCNDVKIELDKCFRLEKEVKRKENLVSNSCFLNTESIIV
jgi:hypothetical protein